HGNKASDSSVRGTEAWYFTPYSYPLANSVSKQVSRYFTNNVYSDGSNKNRGAKQSYYYVTLEQDFASILVEIGFVSNYEEAMAMSNSKHQDGIANAIANGIEEYLSR
ncbi:MAG: N-acetylmuramoyl-L-alanine amidase, partial [Oscillospiraceae bacterium]|nr:N-acetylmuramoyl-L-alanine amidase [Oscillospiraceae bacterium]